MEETIPTTENLSKPVAEPRNQACQALSLKQVVSRYESMGGGSFAKNRSYGCEFGLFQRRSDFESVSFLRWCSIQPAPLLLGLKNRFDAIDDVTRLRMRRDGPRDWNAIQEKYGMFAAHTGLSYAEHSEEQARAKYHRALVFLRDKFLEDLATSDKIFVYRVGDGALAPDEVQNLAAAVHGYGGRPMLYVKVDEAHPFEVSRVNEALLVGTIDRFAVVNDLSRHNDTGWEKVCRAALLAQAGGNRSTPRDDARDAARYRWLRQNADAICAAGPLPAKGVDALVDMHVRRQECDRNEA